MPKTVSLAVMRTASRLAVWLVTISSARAGLNEAFLTRSMKGTSRKAKRDVCLRTVNFTLAWQGTILVVLAPDCHRII